MNTPTCPTCQKGQLALKKKYRMSTPVVIIGWLFLIPSFIGMLIGLLGLFATGKAATTTSAGIEQRARADLEAAKIPASMIESIVAGRVITAEDQSGLTDSQRATISAATTSLTASKIGAGAGTAIAGGFSIGIIVMAFVGGLLGWILVMKKKVLQCPMCSAVVPAS